MTLALELVAVAALILLNGFFVGAEYALVTVRRTRLQELAEEGHRRAKQVLGLTAVPARFIAAMQLGVTVTSLAIGALGEHALTKIFDPVMATVLAVVALAAPPDVLPRRRRRARSEGSVAAVLRADRAARRDARARVLLRAEAADLVPAALERGDAAPARARGAERRRRRLLGGRAEAAPRALDGRGRARGRGAGDALQGLRLRRQGGVRRDGAAARGGRRRRGHAAGGVPAQGARLAVHAVPGLPGVARAHHRRPAPARPAEGDERAWHRRGLGRGDPAAAVHRPGDQGHRRAPDRVPADEPAHGDRRRRVRRHGGDRHARGRDRGDRRRDRGRVRPARRVDRAARRPAHPHRRHLPDRRLQRAVRRRAADRGLPHDGRLRLRAARPPPEAGDELVDGALHFTVVDVEGSRIERLEVEFLPKSAHDEPRAADG